MDESEERAAEALESLGFEVIAKSDLTPLGWRVEYRPQYANHAALSVAQSPDGRVSTCTEYVAATAQECWDWVSHREDMLEDHADDGHAEQPVPGCPACEAEPSVWNVEVQVKVRADDEEQAWRRVHDYMAATITGPDDIKSEYVVDFDILEEAATREDD